MLSYYLLFTLLLISISTQRYHVILIQRDTQPLLSYLETNNSFYKQVFNPTWVEASPGTNNKEGLLIRTQNCDYQEGKCVFCGGSEKKASILTYSYSNNNTFSSIKEGDVAFGPSIAEDSWGTQDPRMVYNPKDQLYYMMYTAYNGSSILLSLATAKNPFDRQSWTKRGPVFPQYQNSKSGAILIRETGKHYLFWGDSSIRVTSSDNLTQWDNIGKVLLTPRPDKFDSRLVQSGPPPLRLKNGNYLFFYNSAELNWPDDPKTGYHVGWVILDGSDPTRIISRSDTPLMGPQYSWQKGSTPYKCNVPNVVFLQAVQPLGNDRFRVFFGGADATIGSAVVQVTTTPNLISDI